VLVVDDSSDDSSEYQIRINCTVIFAESEVPRLKPYDRETNLVSVKVNAINS